MVITYPPLVEVLKGPNMILGRLADAFTACFPLKERERCDFTPSASMMLITCGTGVFRVHLYISHLVRWRLRIWLLRTVKCSKEYFVRGSTVKAEAKSLLINLHSVPLNLPFEVSFSYQLLNFRSWYWGSYSFCAVLLRTDIKEMLWRGRILQLHKK